MSTARFQFAASRTHKWFSRICCQFESIEHLSLGCASSGCRGLASSFDAFAMKSKKVSMHYRTALAACTSSEPKP